MQSLRFLSLFLLVVVIFVTFVAKCNATTETPSTPVGGLSTTVGGSTAKIPDDARTKIKEQVVALTEACKNNAKLPADLAKIASNQGIPKTEAEKCFLECIYQGLNITKEGKFNEPAARNLAKLRFSSSQDELTKANNMIDACMTEVVVKDTNEKCALGRLVRECFVKHGAKINFFPKP